MVAGSKANSHTAHPLEEDRQEKGRKSLSLLLHDLLQRPPVSTMENKPIKAILIRNDAELQKMASKMRESAKEAPCTRPPTYSPDIQSAMENARRKEVREDVDKEMDQLGGRIQLLFLPPSHFITVELSLETYLTPPQWHLSMSYPVPGGIVASVPKSLAKRVVKAFFGGDSFEIPNPGGMTMVAHYGQVFRGELP